MRRLFKKVLILFCLLPLAAFAQTYYVSTSGRNANPGTVQSPWRNINFAMTRVAPGATVIVRSGTYNERVVINKSGTVSAPITLRSESSTNKAQITGTGLTGGALVEIASGVSHVKVIDLDIGNLSGGDTPIGISIDGSGNFIELRGNVVHHITNPTKNAHGIAIYGSAAMPISNLVIDGNEIHNCKLGQSEALVLNGNVTNFAVINNFVHDNDNIGIDFIGFEETNVTVSWPRGLTNFALEATGDLSPAGIWRPVSTPPEVSDNSNSEQGVTEPVSSVPRYFRLRN